MASPGVSFLLLLRIIDRWGHLKFISFYKIDAKSGRFFIQNPFEIPFGDHYLIQSFDENTVDIKIFENSNRKY